MKSTVLAFSLLFFSLYGAFAQLAEIPDEKFRGFLQQNFPGCMEEGKLDTGCREVRKAKYLDVRGLSIVSLEGIEHFDRLERLWCSTNQLKSLEINQLKNLRQLLCSNNQIEKLNLQDLTKLTLVSCFNNELVELNVAGANVLETIACDNNKLEELKLTGLPNLSHLNCRLNKLNELDLSNLSATDAEHAILDCVADKIELKGIDKAALISEDVISGEDSKPYVHWLINRAKD